MPGTWDIGTRRSATCPGADGEEEEESFLKGRILYIDSEKSIWTLHLH